MSINDIFEMIKQLGIAAKIDNNGNITFYDLENECVMEASYTRNPLPTVPTNEIKPLISVHDITLDTFYTLRSPKKIFSFCLGRPLIGKKVDEQSIMIENARYVVVTGEKTFDEYDIRFESTPRNNTMKISSNRGEGLYTEITIQDDEYMAFRNALGYGEFDREFDDEFELQSQQMIDIFDSNELISVFAGYYGKLYPQILKTIDTFNQKKQSRLHM